MFEKSTDELTKMGAEITTREIRQQPELWLEAFDLYEQQYEKIAAFLKKADAETEGRIRVVFTGAGTSQYVGDTIVPYLNRVGNTEKYIFESLATTSIVSSPEDNLHADDPTILVSFARSGNSPESVATVDIANKLVKNLFHITITCAKEGALAKAAEGDQRNLLLLQPERSNDGGFAMTGSFTCMSLTAMLVFDEKTLLEEKRILVQGIAELGNEVVKREPELQKIVDLDFERIVYLGSGSLGGLTRESQLKILELTAGKIATVYDTSMGFRHGPKSFVNDKTLVFVYLNNASYTRQYDLDILHEVAGDDIAKATIAITQNTKDELPDGAFVFQGDVEALPEGYLALPCQMFAQTIALLTSVKVGNTPDTPSPTGTVNRVVKGVTIHPY